MTTTTLPQNPGVFKVVHVTSDRTLMVSTAKNVHRRRIEILSELKRNQFSNHEVQDTYNREGVGSIEIELLEECSVTDLEAKKQSYLRLLLPKSVGVNLTGDSEEEIRSLLFNDWLSDRDMKRVKTFYHNKYPHSPEWPSGPIRAWPDPVTGIGRVDSTYCLERRKEALGTIIQFFSESVDSEHEWFEEYITMCREQIALIEEYFQRISSPEAPH